MLPDLSSCDLILGGAFNCWINPFLDRSSPTSKTQLKSAKGIQVFMDEFNATDPWRFFNSNKREYSFFFHVHHTYTQIDFFLGNNKLLSSISGCKYNPIVMSDHASTFMLVHFQKYIVSRPPWRLDTLFVRHRLYQIFL